LLLDFVRDGEFVFEALALALLFDQRGNRLHHGVERIAERGQLVPVGHANAK